MNRLFPAPVNRVCEEHLTLDLAKLGALPPGARRRLPALHTSDWEWQPWCNGGYVLDRTSRWASAILTRDGDTLRVSVSSSSKTSSVERTSHEITLVEAPNAIGGSRLWFRCPRCGRSVRTVFFRYNAFGCRTCADLKHRSTVTFKPQRMAKRADEILRQLGGSLTERPRYMRRRRHAELLSEYACLRRALGPLTVRKLGKLPPLYWSPTLTTTSHNDDLGK